jgi:NTE family protein
MPRKSISPCLVAIAATTFLFLAGVASAAAQTPAGRPRVGLALGGGGARGVAHVGVLRWLEEHRIPIDAVAGTSMGGLIGGGYATGMTPDEIDALLTGIDWEAMFGASRFQFVNVRRKRDLRDYPSRLEFGLKGGIVPPPSLNNGQQVDLLLSRIAAGSYGIASFDDLPTPFRCVAVDLKRARPVVLGDGSLARAMRATMSMPLVFPPVIIDDQVLVDGGAMNNIPADVARGMGVDRVIAVNVGELGTKATLDYSMVGLVLETLEAMIRAATLRTTATADVMITVPLAEYSLSDFRRTNAFIAAGYAAAEAMRAQLLPLAIGESDWQRWHSARAKARRTALPTPAFVEVSGAGVSDAELMRKLLQPHLGVPFDVSAIEKTILELGGLDRYETLSWALVSRGGEYGLEVTARPKSFGPPFVFLGLSLENTTGNEFRFGLGGRLLAFDVLGSGSELRVDAAVGTEPLLSTAWYRPLFGQTLFVEPSAGVGSEIFSVIDEDRIVASYRRSRVGVGIDAGVNLGRLDEVRGGVRYGWTAASVTIGDPGLPEIDGEDAEAHLQWVHDGQDDAIVPSRGVHLRTTLRHFLSAPFVVDPALDARSTSGVTQAEASVSWLKSLDANARRRIFAGGAAGTSFGGRPFPTEQFSLGGPLRMSAFSVGEQRGDQFAVAGAGYLHQVARLPNFLGGRVFLGGWLETGAAVDRGVDWELDTHASAGLIADTLIGPVLAGASVGMDGDSRFYIGIGRLFR